MHFAGQDLPARRVERPALTPKRQAEYPGQYHSPELGVLIILGVLGLLVLVAWVFSRVGDDGRRGPADRTLL